MIVLVKKFKYTLIFLSIGVLISLLFVFKIDEKGFLISVTNVLSLLIFKTDSLYNLVFSQSIAVQNMIYGVTNVLSVMIFGLLIDFFRDVKKR